MKDRYEKIAEVVLGFLLVVVVTALIFLCLLCGGCTRKVYVPLETVRTEKDMVTRWLTDTVIQNDTRFIFVKGDTVIDWRDRWRERIKEVHDTLYIERTDTVRVPVPVERKLKKWEQTKMDFGGAAIGATVVVLCIAVIWLIKKFRK